MSGSLVSGAWVPSYLPEVCPTLQADCGERVRSSDVPLLGGTWWNGSTTAPTITQKHDHRMPDAGMCFAVLQPLPLPVPLAVRTVQTGANGIGVAEDVSHTLDGAQGQAIAFSAKDYGGDAGPLSPTLRSGTHDLSHANGGVMPAVAMSTVVRRLTPRECERLQGLPDDWTLVPYRGKPASDSPRYKAIGNGMAMPVLRWIGQRIAMVEGERNA